MNKQINDLNDGIYRNKTKMKETCIFRSERNIYRIVWEKKNFQKCEENVGKMVIRDWNLRTRISADVKKDKKMEAINFGNLYKSLKLLCFLARLIVSICSLDLLKPIIFCLFLIKSTQIHPEKNTHSIRIQI